MHDLTVFQYVASPEQKQIVSKIQHVQSLGHSNCVNLFTLIGCFSRCVKTWNYVRFVAKKYWRICSTLRLCVRFKYTRPFVTNCFNHCLNNCFHLFQLLFESISVDYQK